MKILMGLFFGALISTSAQTEEKATTNDVQDVAAMAVVEVDAATEAREVAKVVQREKEAKEKEREKKKLVDPWEAFEPPPDSNFDWLQLTSGEWLKGDFLVLYDYDLEFDSDEMNLQTFDFEDVKRVRTRGMKTVLVQGEGGRRDISILRGMLEIEGDQVILRRAEHDVKIPRSKVISIADGRQRERDYWSGMVSLGINARGGNTKTTDATIMANAKRRTAKTRLNADYLANYSQSGKDETANNQRLSGYYDRFISSRYYWQVAALEFYRDPFSNIDRQYSLSMGWGYTLAHSSRTEWDVNGGAGYQNQQFVSVQVGDEESASSPFFTTGTYFDFEVTKSLDYLFDYNFRLLNKDNGFYTHHMLTKLSFDLFKDFDLDVSLVWDRIEKPQQAADGHYPKKDDYQVIVSLAYDF
jgi:putative salt-induced outer membrane protein YdiY